MALFEIDVPAIRGIMGEKRINVSALSKAIGISRNTLSNYFENPHKMTCDVILKIISALDIPAERVMVFF